MSSRPERIICLCPSLTEALFDMGAGDRVVGVTDWCVHPEDEVMDLPKVGGTKTPNLETIFSLNPDLVIMNEEENTQEDFQEIQSKGIDVLNTFPKTVDQASSTLIEIGDRIGCAQEAQEIGEAIAREKQNVMTDREGRKNLRFVYLIWRRPYMTVNGDTFVNDLLTLAGGVNIFDDHETRYPQVNPETLAEVKPDVIFLPSEPYAFTAPHAAEVCADAGISSGRVELCDGERLSWYGSRTPEGIRYANQLMAKLAKRI